MTPLALHLLGVEPLLSEAALSAEEAGCGCVPRAVLLQDVPRLHGLHRLPAQHGLQLQLGLLQLEAVLPPVHRAHLHTEM